MNKKYLKDFAFLGGVIVFCAIAARLLSGGETLEEYANKNKESADVSSDVSSAYSTAQTEKESFNEASSTDFSLKDISSDTQTESVVDASFESSSAIAPDISSDRIVYQDGFYYEPISNDVFKRISGISYPVDCQISLDELRYLNLKYIDFNGDAQTGEMICNKSIAEDIVEIFYELYESGYQIESIILIDEYNGDDTASMLANNTSCFNYRVVEGTTRLSNHAKGLAIDLNPFYNPYITYNGDGTKNISPVGSELYADRSADFPYKIDENDLAYKLFKEHGFTWGGNWNSVKDYQHFERSN